MTYSVVDSHHIAMGQVGSAYLDATEDAASLTGNLVVIAITMVEDTTFDTTTGLVATDAAYMGTGTSTHGNSIDNADIFPAGLTIYGRWNRVNVYTGSCIIYLGT